MNRYKRRSSNNLFMIADAAMIVAALFAAYPLRFTFLSRFPLFAIEAGEKYLSFSDYTENIIFLLPGYLIIYYILDIYKSRRGHSLFRTFRRLLEGNLLGIFFFAFLLYIKKENDISRWFYIVFGILNFSFAFVSRVIVITILNILRKHGRNLRHILIVGYSRAAEGFIDRVCANPGWGYKIHGILDNSLAEGTRYKQIPVIGGYGALEETIAHNDFDEIVIALCLDDYEELEGIAAICEKSGVHTKFIPDYNNIISTVPNIEDMYGLPVINIRNIPLSDLSSRIVKRIGDLVLGVIALVVFAIPMLIVALIIKLTSPGPIIYAQERIGLHGKTFKMFKFRSMYVEDPEEEKSGWTRPGDTRITPVGKFIRKTSIDELPQLFNVLGGSMSLVGPRPERPQFVERFKEEIPRYMVKHQVRPGMTGWAQVNGYRGDTSITRRIEHDLYYIENWSIGLDMRIFILTVFKGFINKNAY